MRLKHGVQFLIDAVVMLLFLVLMCDGPLYRC